MAASRSRDVFVVAVVLVGAAITWLASLAGFSPALGAFLAGMVLADSEYGHQALSDSLALRDLFTSLFFVSIGMLLDFRTGFEQPAMVAGVVAAVLLGKAAIAAFAGVVLRFPVRIALLAGFGVAQIGEFSFVLARQGADAGLLTGNELRVFFAASVITMFIAPLALRFGPGLAAGASRLQRPRPPRTRRAPAAWLRKPASPDPQVVILGYGVGGELLAEVLREAGMPFVALDLNGERVRQARRQGTPLYYGDVTSREILERAGVGKAMQVVVVLNDPRATLHAVRVAREVGPKAVIIARARYVGETHGAARGRRRRGRGPGTRGVVHDHRTRDAGSAAAPAATARVVRPDARGAPEARRRAAPGRPRGRERRGARGRLDCRPEPGRRGPPAPHRRHAGGVHAGQRHRRASLARRCAAGRRRRSPWWAQSRRSPPPAP